MSTSVYYQHSGPLPLASRLSLRARGRMFQRFMRAMRPDSSTRVLDVGVTCDQSHPESNFFERMFPYPANVTCVGTEDGSHLETLYPGITYRRVASGQPLPFADRSFDVVFSNAVVEHVGTRRQQAAFVAELCRVGRFFFVTTPNRWFPVEHHTGLPLLHYLPAPLFRATLARSRYQYWADEAHLNILTARELRRIFPTGATVEISRVRLFGVTSNLIAHGRAPGE